MSVDYSSSVYNEAERYWKSVAADVDGMLGGFSHLSDADIHDSRRFLKYVLTKLKITPQRALDCGSGIGRITKYLLLPMFESVDMVDVTEEFINQSSAYLGDELNKRVEHKFCCGLQDLVPECGRYDIIWIQWVSGHLTDNDLIEFLKRCRSGLTSNGRGCIVVKENMSSTNDRDFDEVDHSWTRARTVLVDIFEKAGLKIINEQVQKNFPKGMYQVRMFALC